ncbi:MAG TPA: cytochrome c oxidase subunit 4 [Actinomycetes bacterium]|nr:cytochrome c oxidase subunit 4 [Actinomycetes bacterium]
MTDEAAALLRVSIFGVAAALAYWLVSSEPLGSVAMLALGLGAGFAGLLLLRAERRRAVREPFRDLVLRFVGLPRVSPGAAADLAGEDLAVIPRPSVWPFTVGLGVAVTATGLIFGTWLLLLGLALLLWGLWGWAATASRDAGLDYREERSTGSSGSVS